MSSNAPALGDVITSFIKLLPAGENNERTITEMVQNATRTPITSDDMNLVVRMNQHVEKHNLANIALLAGAAMAAISAFWIGLLVTFTAYTIRNTQVKNILEFQLAAYKNNFLFSGGDIVGGIFRSAIQLTSNTDSFETT